jgi:hypothetical protein
MWQEDNYNKALPFPSDYPALSIQTLYSNTEGID